MATTQKRVYLVRHVDGHGKIIEHLVNAANSSTAIHYVVKGQFTATPLTVADARRLAAVPVQEAGAE